MKKDAKPEELTPYDLLVKAIDYTLNKKTNVAYNDKGNLVYDLMDQMGLFKKLGKAERVRYLEKVKEFMRTELSISATTPARRRELQEILATKPHHPDVIDMTKRVIVAAFLKDIASKGPGFISNFLEEFRSKIK